MSHSHHPSALKQQNKRFKTRHSTKGDLKRQAKGRIPRISPKSAAKASLVASATRLNRQNSAKQAQIKKRQELISATKVFGGPGGAPRIAAVIPLTSDVRAVYAVKSIVDTCEIDTSTLSASGEWTTRVDRFKANLRFLLLPHRNFYAALDACKAADYVIFVMSPTEEIDQWGELLMRCLQSQGLPEVVSVMQTQETLQGVSRPQVLKSLLSWIRYFVPSQTKVHDLSIPSHCLNAIRSICEGRPEPVRWREGRSWLLSSDVRWESNEPESPDSQLGNLIVKGTIRGAPMSANRLMHIPNLGDFQVEKIMSLPSLRRVNVAPASGMDFESAVLQEASPDDAESLTSRLDPDSMANEQTWPTEEEMAHAGKNPASGHLLPDAADGTTPKRVKRVPRGTSAYQAAWIIDDEDEDEDADDGLSNDGEDVSMEGEDDRETERALTGRQSDPDDEDLVDVTEDMESGTRQTEFEDMDMEVENQQHADWKAARDKEKSRTDDEENDREFPDEVDTPRDVPARQRFARYRGLRSFRTSPWDPFENLPVDYARIFRFEDYERTRRKVSRKSQEEGVAPGTAVILYLKNVPRACADSYDGVSPFVLFGLWEHEHKTTVLHFAVQRNTEYTGSVKSKEPLLLCVGPRRYLTNPIYSQHVRGGDRGQNNVHKFERYLRPGQTSVATVYGPSCFGKLPCTLLRVNPDDPQAPFLVASGTFLNPDTKRIIAKRIVLTGHPYKVHRRVATIRFMFFNPTDINYFKPIELHTKYGRTGHIVESLGTHGYFKAHFDKPLSQVDTVCLNLYKRVYPRWSTPFVAPKPALELQEEAME